MCESCAGEDDDLVLVRLTVHDEARPDGGEARTELWCFDCRTEQAHHLVEEQA